MHAATLALTLLLLSGVAAAAVRRAGAAQLPISSDDRRITRASECHFGRRVYELGAHWFADLGPPFGVMYCIRCECVAVKKKRRVVARAQCRNVKTECPAPSCDHPVLQPGRCCKVCPGDDAFSPDVLPTEPTVKEVQTHTGAGADDERRKHMAAVLTSRVAESLFREDPERAPPSSLDALPPAAATGRFQLSRRSLYFSFYVADAAPRPRAVQFRSEEGDILVEMQLGEGGRYQREAGKVCGAWRRLPRDYRRLLREGRLYAMLLWPPSLLGQLPPVAGQIIGHHSLTTEVFSGLLEERAGGDAAATAVVSVHAAPDTSSVHLSLLLSADVPQGAQLVARLEDEAGRAIVEETVRAPQPQTQAPLGGHGHGHNHNQASLSEVELRSPVGAGALRQLAAGRLRASLSAADAGGRRLMELRGRVTARVSCEILQAVLTPTEAASAEGSRSDDSPAAPSAGVGGVAWMFARRDGSLSYGATLSGLEALSVRMLTLTSARGTEIYDLTPALSDSGEASGELGPPGVSELRQLTAGELWLAVSTQRAAVARGRLAPRLVAAARDAERPAHLLPPPPAPTLTPTSAAGTAHGLAWVAVDSECTLHLDVTLIRGGGGESRDEEAEDAEEAREWLSVQLMLEARPLEAPGAPVWSRELAALNASRRGRAFQLEESLADVPAAELARLEYGVCDLVVRDATTGQLLLSGRLPQTKVPASCQPRSTDNDVVPVLHQEAAGAGAGAGPGGESGPCLWEQRFYEEGAQWRAPGCRACHCLRGRARCEPQLCPPAPASCPPDGRKPTPPPGDCCPACHNETSAQESRWGVRRGCSVSGEFHAAGSSWYPYVPPHGFDTCVTVSCDAVTLQVRFWRRRCPALDCGGRRPVRPDPRACCRVCPPADTADDEPGGAGAVAGAVAGAEREPEPDPQAVLAAGGCRAPHQVFEDGRSWHPRIQPFGVEKCVTCRCKAGHIQCQRKVCKAATCARLQDASAAPGAAPAAPEEEAEERECCRTQCARRHRRPHG
ncbi:dorsal-ventral patterning protein Sog-like [Schistocerca gregaria]|uniref:dorsal-ventral patterning protein Sog-like n=1 Tax=Schistocerca gregaria TaxID=7010 RepID=UPI00211DDC7C|nr:dorsal-ventral patterning protein Sog-like [Schistocerca gregaria]